MARLEVKISQNQPQVTLQGQSPATLQEKSETVANTGTQPNLPLDANSLLLPGGVAIAAILAVTGLIKALTDLVEASKGD